MQNTYKLLPKRYWDGFSENKMRERVTGQWSALPIAYQFEYREELDGVMLYDNNGLPLTPQQHLGLIELLSNMVINYKGDFEKDVTEYRNNVLKELTRSDERVLDDGLDCYAKRNPRKKHYGYVYFLECNHKIKIGRAKELKSRMSAYGVMAPFKTNLIHSLKTDDCCSLEKYFHELFEEKRVEGEWFELDEKDMRAIKTNQYLSNEHFKTKKRLKHVAIL